MQRSSTRSRPPGHCRRRGSSWRRRRPPFSVEPADRSHAGSPARGAIPGRLQLERQPAPSVGYEWERETNPDVTGFDLDNNAVFAQHQSTFANRWFLTVGARIDSKERYDTYVSPKLSAGGFALPYRAGALSSVKLFGNVGRGVKSPTFTERFGGAGFADPNPDIKVEQAKSGGPRRRGDFCRSEAPCHGNCLPQRLHRPDFLSLRTDGRRDSGVHQHRRLESQRSGVGAGAAAAGGRTDGRRHVLVRSHGSRHEPDTSQQFQPGQPLLRRPRHAGSFRASYSHGRATVNFNLRMIGDRFDNSFLFLRTVPNAERPTATTTDITINPGYVVAGLGLDVRVRQGLTIFFRGDNIGDIEGALAATSQADAFFSIGSDSPVSADWLTKKSFALSRRRSAGWHASPRPARRRRRARARAEGSRIPCPRAVHVVLTIASRRSTALFDWASCTYARITLSTTMSPTTTKEGMSSIASETNAMTSSCTTRGFFARELNLGEHPELVRAVDRVGTELPAALVDRLGGQALVGGGQLRERGLRRERADLEELEPRPAPPRATSWACRRCA